MGAKVLDRGRKLLALSQSFNPAEAASAQADLYRSMGAGAAPRQLTERWR